jgi:hypothetical protein
MNDLCECICNVIGRHLQTLQQILNNINNQESFSTRGADGTVIAPLTPPNSFNNMSNPAMLALLFAFLFVGWILSQDRNRNSNRDDALLLKPTDNSNIPPHNRNNRNNDRDGDTTQ